MRKINLFIIFLIFLVVSLESVSIYLSNKMAADSISVKKLEGEFSSLEQKNQNLKSEFLVLTSFEQVASRAAEVGFIDAKDTITLTSPLPVAVKK